MLPRPYPFVIENAVGQDFIDHVTRLTLQKQDLFEVNGSEGGRKFLHMDFVTPDGDRILFETKQRLAELYQLGDYVVPPKLRDFIGYLTEGGFIHAHRDQDLPGKRHVRINVLVRAAAGCVPLLEEIPIKVGVGGAWFNLAWRLSSLDDARGGPGLPQRYQLRIPDRGAVGRGALCNPPQLARGCTQHGLSTRLAHPLAT